MTGVRGRWWWMVTGLLGGLAASGCLAARHGAAEDGAGGDGLGPDATELGPDGATATTGTAQADGGPTGADTAGDAEPACGSWDPDTDPIVVGELGGGPLCGRLTVFAIDRTSLRRDVLPGARVRVTLSRDPAATWTGTTDEDGRVVFEDPALTGSVTVAVAHPGRGFLEVHGVRAAVASMPIGRLPLELTAYDVTVTNPEVLGAVPPGGTRWAEATCIERDYWIRAPAGRATFQWGEPPADPAAGATVATLALEPSNCVGIAVSGWASAAETPSYLGFVVRPLPGFMIGDPPVAVTLDQPLDHPRTVHLAPRPEGTADNGHVVQSLLVLPGGGIITTDLRTIIDDHAELPLPALDGALAGATWGAVATAWTATQRGISIVMVVGRTESDTSVELGGWLPFLTATRRGTVLTLDPEPGADAIEIELEGQVPSGVAARTPVLQPQRLGGRFVWLAPEVPGPVDLAKLPLSATELEAPGIDEIWAFGLDGLDLRKAPLSSFGMHRRKLVQGVVTVDASP